MKKNNKHSVHLGISMFAWYIYRLITQVMNQIEICWQIFVPIHQRINALSEFWGGPFFTFSSSNVIVAFHNSSTILSNVVVIWPFLLPHHLIKSEVHVIWLRTFVKEHITTLWMYWWFSGNEFLLFFLTSRIASTSFSLNSDCFCIKYILPYFTCICVNMYKKINK